MKLLIYLLMCLVLFAQNVFAQATNLGLPKITNYYKKNIFAGTQTWDIDDDTLGYTYFANNSGLLIFDGYNWDIYPILNNTIVRSVAADDKGRIYVGGQGDFGYFEINNKGILQYTSLSIMLKTKVEFGDIWDIVIRADGIFFRSDNHVFRYQNDKLELIFTAPQSLLYMGEVDEKLWIQDGANIFYEYIDGQFIVKQKNSHFDKGRVSAILPYLHDTILITTIDNGIYYESDNGYQPWRTSIDDQLKKANIYCATYAPSVGLILGTSLSGCYIINEKRKITEHLSKSTGMQNVTVLSSHITKEGHVWLGLDNGVDFIDINTPFRYFYPDGPLEGTGYSALLHQGRLYFGMNTGIYSIPWQKYYMPDEKSNATLIQGTKGQVWSLNKIGEDLLAGHHSGAFQIQNDKAVKISNILGVWKFIDLGDRLSLAGHYNGFSLFEKVNERWTLKHHVSGFKESARIIHKDKYNQIWVAHPYRGIYTFPQMELMQGDIRVKKFSENNPLNTALKNNFHIVENKLIFDNGNTFFSGEDPLTKLEEFKILDDIVEDHRHLQFLISDDYNNIWYGINNQGYVAIPQKTFEKSYKTYKISEITGLLPGGFESVLTIDPENVVFPTEKGFLFFNPTKYIKNSPKVELFLSKAVLNGKQDSILFSGMDMRRSGIPNFNLHTYQNNISFFFAIKSSGSRNRVSFSYRLLGLKDQWSDWSTDSKIAFTGIPPGSFVLEVRAKNDVGEISKIHTAKINISFPWYKTKTAYAAYFVMLLCLALYFFYLQKKKHEKEKTSILELNKKREEEHLNMAAASKEEITRLQNEKLLSELNYKNQELTSFTYHLVNKNELISEINSAIHKIETKFHDQTELKKELKHIQKLTEKNTTMDADWENFVKSFDQVHTNFFKRLKEEFADLSPTDYKLCTYLRMNLTTKEIASLMNISIRSAETNRYRLRKKLNLDSDTNLTQFLMEY